MKAEEFLKNTDKYANERIFLIYGDQDYLKDMCVKKLMELFGADDMSAARFEGPPMSADLIGALQNISFFSPYSTVIADSLPEGNEAERVMSFLQELPDYSRLIFSLKNAPDKRKSFVKKLLKICVEIEAKEGADLPAWIVAEGKRQGIKISKDGAEHMIHIAGEDMYTLKSEINKLSFLGKKEITLEDIEENVSKGTDYNIFLLNTLMLEGQYDRGFALANQIIREEKSAIPLVALLSGRFYQMYLARCCLDAKMSAFNAAEELQKSAGINKYAAKYVINDAKRLSAQRLKEGVRLLAKYDAALKTGGADEGIEYILTKLYV